MRDPYEVLGVDRKASGNDVKSAFRRQAKKLHPDANKNDPNAASRFAELNAAYEILGEDDKRKAQIRRPFDQTSDFHSSKPVLKSGDSYNSNLIMTGTWSDGRSHARASRRTCIPFTESPSAGLTQIWSNRRPLLAFCQSGER